MRTIVKRVRFEDMTVDYINMTEEPNNKIEGKHLTGRTNPETWSLMKDRFVILRNFIPESITNMSLDAWKTIESNEEVDAVIFHKEHEITQGSPKESLGKSKAGYCTPHGVALHRWLGDELKGIIDMDLRETYSYTRKYDRGAYLRAHTDRPSCEISATVCLDYHCDDGKPWSIWVQNEEDYIDLGCMEKAFEISQGLPHRKRKGIKIDLEVGDVLLYQGPNVIHWRDYLLGDYSYHIFMHFINRESKMGQINEWSSNDTGEHYPSGSQYPVLTFDGRSDRYSKEIWDSPQKEAMNKFNTVYETIDNKTKYVNNFSNLELHDPKERRKRNDSI